MVSPKVTYIDFERLGTADAIPALLGVLKPFDEGYRYTAYVLDPRLSRAAAARKYCCAADLRSVIASITSDSDAKVVSWSEFDREVVLGADLRGELKTHFAEHWENALSTVRPWKSRLYSEWALSVGNADGHALKVYMKALGYQVPAALAPGRAAYWLRHVLERLEAADGNYSQLSPRAKRHWHNLREYNRNDCEGMRVVYERACRELELQAAYRATTFTCEVGGESLEIRVGRPHPRVDATLRAFGARTWACITAHNPQPRKCSEAENKRQDEKLKGILGAGGIAWHPAVGAGDGGAWPAEPGVLAMNVSYGRAESLGRRFGQAAVVWGRAGENAELVWCNQLRGVTRRVRADHTK